MKKKLFILIVCISFLSGYTRPSELFKQIKESKTTLHKTNKEKLITNNHLRKLAQEIKKLKSDISSYDKKLKKLQNELNSQKERYQKALSQITGIEKIVKELDRDIEVKRKEFAKKVAEQLGTTIAKNKTSYKDEKSVIMQEVLNRYKDINQKELLKLSRNIEQKKALRKNLLEQKKDIEDSIKDIAIKYKKYEKEKNKKEKLVKKLEKEEKLYSQKLKKIFKKETLIRLTLAKLNLLQEDSIKKAKEREQELKRRIKAYKKGKLSSNYKSTPIKHTKAYVYKGAKTIAPLKLPKIVSNFGVYKDPIYHMSSKRDYVILATNSSDKRVFNVLDGKVVYIGKKAMFGNMVVIEHKNGIHTIYGNLDKFSPLIHINDKITKGAIIGKVKRKLMFEATKNGRILNPLSLINL